MIGGVFVNSCGSRTAVFGRRRNTRCTAIASYTTVKSYRRGALAKGSRVNIVWFSKGGP